MSRRTRRHASGRTRDGFRMEDGLHRPRSMKLSSVIQGTGARGQLLRPTVGGIQTNGQLLRAVSGFHQAGWPGPCEETRHALGNHGRIYGDGGSGVR